MSDPPTYDAHRHAAIFQACGPSAWPTSPYAANVPMTVPSAPMANATSTAPPRFTAARSMGAPSRESATARGWSQTASYAPEAAGSAPAAASTIAVPIATRGAETAAPSLVCSSASFPAAAQVARTVRTLASGSAAGRTRAARPCRGLPNAVSVPGEWARGDERGEATGARHGEGGAGCAAATRAAHAGGLPRARASRHARRPRTHRG